MPRSQPLSPAEAADRHAFLIGVAVLAMALKFAASATAHFVDEPLVRYLDSAEIVFALFAVAVVLWIFSWKVRRLPRSERRAYLGQDSFVVEAMRRSRDASWNVTLVVLVGLELVAKRVEIPSAFFVQATVAAMLAVLGLKFLYISRDDVLDGADA